jgi:hypothetical protein
MFGPGEIEPRLLMFLDIIVANVDANLLLCKFVIDILIFGNIILCIALAKFNEGNIAFDGCAFVCAGTIAVKQLIDVKMVSMLICTSRVVVFHALTSLSTKNNNPTSVPTAATHPNNAVLSL